MALEEFGGTSPPRQRDLTRAIFSKVVADLPEGDTRTQAFQASLAVPGAKDWLKCQAAPELKTYIADRDFRVWLQFYCRIPLLELGTACPRSGCAQELDR